MTKNDIKNAVKIISDAGFNDLADDVYYQLDSIEDIKFNWDRETWLKDHYKKLYDDALYFEANNIAMENRNKRNSV